MKMTKNDIGWIITTIKMIVNSEKDLDKQYELIGEYLIKEFGVEVVQR